MKKNIFLISILPAIAGLLFLGSCKPPSSQSTTDKLKPFQILLDWQPEPTYLGIYYAKEKGYFKDLGLDVEIIPSWGANQAVAAVAAGKYSIATASGGATVLGYNSGAKITSLAVIYPEIPSVIYGLAEKKIREPKDLLGKKIGIYPNSVTANEFDAFLNANQLDRKQLEIVSLTGADIPFVRSGQVDAVLHYWEMSPVVVDLDKDLPAIDGSRTSLIRLSETGVGGYGLNVISSQEALSKDGALLKQVAAAIIKGYEGVRANPEDAITTFVKLFPDKDPEYVRQSLKRVNILLGDKIGAQDKEGWTETIDLYDSLGLLKNKPTPENLIPTTNP